LIDNRRGEWTRITELPQTKENTTIATMKYNKVPVDKMKALEEIRNWLDIINKKGKPTYKESENLESSIKKSADELKRPNYEILDTIHTETS
jgi:hypothetical protein